MFIIHPGADLCQCPGPFHKPKAAGNPAAFLHRETLSRREFLNPCRLRHTSPIPSSLWPAATTGLRRTPAGGISASLKCGRNLRFPHKRPLPCCEKGGRNGESTALRLLTQKPMKPWFHRFFFLSGIAPDPYSDPDAERFGTIQKAPERTFPITSAACRRAVVVTWA